MLRRPLLLAAFVGTLTSISACDQLGIESATVVAARVEADGKAVGAACRHGGRAIEDCFSLNKRTDKADIYAGWREMDDYMRENKIEAVAAELGPDGKPKTQKVANADADDGADDSAAPATDKVADKSATKPGDKAADKPARPDKADRAASADKVPKIDKPAKPIVKPADKSADKNPGKTAAADPDKATAPH